MHIPQDQPELSTEGTPGFATIHGQQGSLANPAPGPSARHIAHGRGKDHIRSDSPSEYDQTRNPP